MPEQTSIHAGHELSGIGTRGVWFFIASFIVTIIAILIAVWVVVGMGARRLERLRLPERSPIGRDQPMKLDQPLQPSPLHPKLDWQDMAALRDSQAKALHQYGKIQGDDAHVQIAIDRAMELVLQNKALLRSADPSAPAQTQPAINTTQPKPTENRT